ncbi:MAG: phasin family protein [Azovibrio sp.]|uniref:phasin family protein n=1 Tax=Azovibrio sp. TaxID=1872673 RepID=UPI003C72684B
MSTPNIEQLTAAQKANAEVMTALLRASFNGMERLAALNMAASREFFNAAVTNTQQLLAIKDPSELPKLNANLAQPALAKWMDYSRNLYDLVTSVQKEVTSVMESQYQHFSKTAAANLDKTKSAPGGDIFAAAMKSALDVSGRAFEQMNAVARQAAEIAETNMQVVANTTNQATSAVSKAAAIAKK